MNETQYQMDLLKAMNQNLSTRDRMYRMICEMTGGAFLYLTDYELWEVTSSSVPGMGFNGIAAAFLGGLNPIGTIFSSYFIQHITSGGAYVDKNLYSSQISDLISAVIIYLCGFVGFMKLTMKKISAAKAAQDVMANNANAEPEPVKEEDQTDKASESEEGGKE